MPNNKNKIELPIYWTQEFKRKPPKTVLVGMNWYRNAHFYQKNAIKQHFHDLVIEQSSNLDSFSKFKLHLELYYKSSNCDGANIVALIEKFALDAFQEINVITNDNVNFHLGSSWEIVEQDKQNPRCLVSLLSV